MTGRMHEHPAYEEGFRSYRKNKGQYVNPYPSSSDERNLFERGWTQALKRSSGALLEPNEMLVARSRPTKTYEKKLKNATKEAYLKSKGH